MGSVILAALVLKLSAYGLVRFLVPCFSIAVVQMSGVIGVVAVVSLVYSGVLTLRQVDIKKVVAYSSIAHMALVMASVVMGANVGSGMLGLLVMAHAHALSSGLLFLLVGMLYDRVHTRLLKYSGGFLGYMPLWSSGMLAGVLANMSMPGSGGFIGEILIIGASSVISCEFVLLLALSLVLSGAYNIWLYSRLVHGNISTVVFSYVIDLGAGEAGVVVVIVALIIVLGLKPMLLIHGLYSSMALVGLSL